MSGRGRKQNQRYKSNAELREQIRQQHERLAKRTRFYMRLIKNWHVLVIGFLTIYVTLPFVAPTLMAAGATGPANALYTVYSPLCHQFSFRSIFLYGEQPFYPRSLADYPGDTFEQQAAQSDEFIELYTERRKNELRDSNQENTAETYVFDPAELRTWTTTLQISAREFKGDEQMGYKVALCQRDIAIYGAMVIGGLGFILVRRRLRPVPLLLYLMLGIAPIGLDGFSQLLGYIDAFADLLPERETTPVFRILTGALFGFMNVWLVFPYLERGMQENLETLETNLAHLEAKMKDQ